MDWRRWLAMLCIALTTALAFEPAHAGEYAQHASADMIQVGDGHVIHVHVDDGADHHPGQQPDHDGDEPHAHFCGGAHAVQLPNSGGEVRADQNVLKLGFAFDTARDTSGPIYGLERPPRRAA
jgi:hypothetical protein